MKKKSSLLIFVSISILIFTLAWLSIEVLKPANISYILSCEPERFKQEYSNKYSVAGQVIVRQSIIGEEIVEEVKIFIEDESTIKHEWIHVKQAENDRLYGCENTILKRINEAEAYAFSNLPDVIFNIVYGKPKI